MDIDYVAFVDNAYAAEALAMKEETKPAFTVNLDQSHNTVNGEYIYDKNGKRAGTTVEIDLKDKALTSTDGLKLGGWVCTRGGIASYKYRVVSADGTAIETPKAVEWPADKLVAGGIGSDIYTVVGKGLGYSDDCAKNCKFYGWELDLSEFAGKTVTVEVFATTNYGAEIVLIRAINVSVPGSVS
jgi:hypothetical protein